MEGIFKRLFTRKPSNAELLELLEKRVELNHILKTKNITYTEVYGGATERVCQELGKLIMKKYKNISSYFNEVGLTHDDINNEVKERLKRSSRFSYPKAAARIWLKKGRTDASLKELLGTNMLVEQSARYYSQLESFF